MNGLKILMVILFLGGCLSGWSQDSSEADYVLALRHKKDRIYFDQYETIQFIIEDTLAVGVIMDIDQSMIRVDSNYFELSEIQKVIDPRGRSFVKQMAVMFPIAGFGYATITTINALINKERPVFLKEHLYPAGALVAAGMMAWPFFNKKYRIGKWEFITIPK